MPMSNGAPASRLTCILPPSVFCSSEKELRNCPGRLYMMKYQLKLVTMYIAHNAQTLRLVKIRRHGTPSCPAAGALPARINSRSAWLVAECSSGRSRNHQVNIATQATATAEKTHSVCRQSSPRPAVRQTQMNGVIPPMNRADSQTDPCAKPRSVLGNQL